jgi:hypothetical protein
MSNNQRIIFRIAGFLLSFMGYMLLITAFGLVFGVEVSGITLGILFLSACVVIYSTLSRFFFQVVIVNDRPMKYSLKDWIKINAYITSAWLAIATLGGIAVLAMPSLLAVLAMPSLLNKSVSDMLAAAAAQPGGATVTAAQGRSLFRVSDIISLILSVSGLVHCIWTLRLVKKYKAYFQ